MFVILRVMRGSGERDRRKKLLRADEANEECAGG
jgi:hypothetical protein